MKTLLTGFLSKTLNMDDEEIAKLFEKGEDGGEKPTENALDVLLKADAERITLVKETLKLDPDKEKALRDEGHQRGTKESLSKLEKDLKGRYKIESDKTGLDLIDEIVKSQQKAPQDVEELRKTHNQEKLDQQKKYDNMDDSYKEKIKGLETGQAKKERLGIVRDKARAKLTDLKAVTKDNPAKIMTGFLTEVGDYDYDIKDNAIIPLDEKGDLLKNEHGNAVSFDEHINKIAGNWFIFQTQDAKGNSGNDNNDDGTTKSYADMNDKEKVVAWNKASAEEREQMKKEFAN